MGLLRHRLLAGLRLLRYILLNKLGLEIVGAAILSVTFTVGVYVLGYSTSSIRVNGLAPAVQQKLVGTFLLGMLALGHFITGFVLLWMARVLFKLRWEIINKRAPVMYVGLGLFLLSIGTLYVVSALRVWAPSQFYDVMIWVFLISGAFSLFTALTFPHALLTLCSVFKVEMRIRRQNLKIDVLADESKRLALELEELRKGGLWQ